MIDLNVIQTITAELNRDELMFMSWGVLNEKAILSEGEKTAYQFDVDGALLFTGTVIIIADADKYRFNLVANSKCIYQSPPYDLKSCVKQLDIKIERGPSKRSYKEHVSEWIKK